MNISELRESKFLKKEDIGDSPVLLTIKDVAQFNVAAQGAPEENKWCLVFEEADKPLVLNSTNGQIIAKITGSEESDDWIGHKIVLYVDPNVSFGGKVVGGIRCRAPKAPKPVPGVGRTKLGKPAQKEVDPTPPAEPDEVPF